MRDVSRREYGSGMESFFVGESFENQTFEDLELEGFDFSGKEFYRCTFRRVKLPSSKWIDAVLEDCMFEDCDLLRMNPARLRVLDVIFRRTRVMGSDWSAVSPNPSFEFEGCDLRHVSFVGTNLRKIKLHDCRATESNFIECNLIEASFDRTELSGANFSQCDVTRADFSGAIGLFLNPARNRVKDTDVTSETAELLAHSLGMRVNGRRNAGDTPAVPKARTRRAR